MTKRLGTATAALFAGAILLSGCGGESDQPTASSATPSPPSAPSPTTSASTSTPTPSVTTPAPEPEVNLVCGQPGGPAEFAAHAVPFAPDGTPDYSSLWPLQLTCDQGYGDLSVVEEAPVETTLHRAVVAAARKAGYGKFHSSDEEILYAVLEGCGGNATDDPYATMDDYSAEQVAELQAWMTLCPKHPQAPQWRKGIAATAKALEEAEAGVSGIFDGTYEVPGDLRRGTYVVKGVEDCYWETRDRNGKILDNDFVVAAPRVVAKVSASAVVFTARGCGEWVRQ